MPDSGTLLAIVLLAVITSNSGAKAFTLPAASMAMSVASGVKNKLFDMPVSNNGARCRYDGTLYSVWLLCPWVYKIPT